MIIAVRKKRLNEINEHAWFVFSCGARNRQTQMPLQVLLGQQLSSPYLTSFVSRIKKKTSQDEDYTQKTENNSYKNREFFKEVTCQTNREDSGSQIKNCPRNKFLTTFIIFHLYEFNHRSAGLSRDFLFCPTHLTCRQAGFWFQMKQNKSDLKCFIWGMGNLGRKIK